MKKVLLFVFALALGWGVQAQCPLQQAVDFNTTDCHGTPVHLFDILDGGQYVLIDFFFTTCGPCQQVTPYVAESYYAFGCNKHDVFYMEISDRNNDAQCQAWVENYGIEYPTIGTSGGGNSICNTYGIGYFPTIILIAPDRSILINDLWPIANAQTIITALENQGVQQHSCDEPTYEETLTFNTDTLWVSLMQDATPLTIFNHTAEPEIHLNKITIDDGDWFFFTYENQQISLGEDFDITIAQGDSIQLDIWMNIYNKDTIYPTLYFENTLETVQLVTAFDWTSSVQVSENQAMILRPNPANDFVTLTGEDLGTVRIFNILGQKVDELKAAGNELQINTTHYSNGIYFVKTGETALRFVVTH